jgi:hypothetical protein
MVTVLDLCAILQSDDVLPLCVASYDSTVFFFHCRHMSWQAVDVDECSVGSDKCDNHADCTNTIGSHDCTCTVILAMALIVVAV